MESEKITKRVVIYTRVSTQEQSADGYSLGEQADRLRMYAGAHGWTVVRVYTDPGFSGAKLDRPAIQQLMADCESGQFDAVLVYKLDRLSRSQKDTLHLIEDVFNPLGIGLISMNENFDTLTPFGKAMIGILSVFAQLERDQITERMTMGRIGRAKAGYFAGGNHAPIGYDFQRGADGNRLLVVNEYEAMQIRTIFDLFLHGIDGKEATLTAIRKYMHERYKTKYGSWTHTSSISRILSDQTYIGKISFGSDWYDGVHDPIIDPETFRTAQEKLRKVPTNYAENFAGRHLLTGLLRCGVCGKPYQIRSRANHRRDKDGKMIYGKAHIRYVCSSSRETRCSNVTYDAEELEETVTFEVRKLRGNPSVIRMAAAPAQDDGMRSAILKRLEALRTQESRLIDLYQIGSIDVAEVKKRSDAIRDEEASLQRDLSEAEVRPAALDPEQAIAILSNFDSVFSSGSLDDRRQLLRSLIDYVEIFPDRIAIHWLFDAR